jgi:TIGR03009 family protein
VILCPIALVQMQLESGAMFKTYITFLGFVVLLPVVSAQPPATPQPKLDPNDRLDSLLIKWERTMAATQSFWAPKCERTDKDKTGTKTYKGEIRILKPNYYALSMTQQQNPNIFEMYVCTGTYLYEFRPQSRKLVIHELDQGQPGAGSGIQKLLTGISAADIKRRFDAKLVPDVAPGARETVTIELKPKFADDKRAFSQVRIVLWEKTMLPRQLALELPNGNEITWNLPNVDTETKLKPVDFTPPRAPDGWEQVKAPRN